MVEGITSTWTPPDNDISKFKKKLLCTYIIRWSQVGRNVPSCLCQVNKSLRGRALLMLRAYRKVFPDIPAGARGFMRG